jgi:hypothetical protein
LLGDLRSPNLIGVEYDLLRVELTENPSRAVGSLPKVAAAATALFIAGLLVTPGGLLPFSSHARLARRRSLFGGRGGHPVVGTVVLAVGPREPQPCRVGPLTEFETDHVARYEGAI